jgi:putative FmdB family regulatory protein
MPIYEYVCLKCGNDLEVLQKVTDSALRKCPKCGALRLKRKVSAPQFRLKGTGWYETDFKKDKKKRLADAGDGASADKPEGKGGDGAPAKPDAKAPKETKESEPPKETKESKPPKETQKKAETPAAD